MRVITQIPAKIDQDRKIFIRAPIDSEFVGFDSGILRLIYDTSKPFVLLTLFCFLDGEEVPDKYKFIGRIDFNRVNYFVFLDVSI